MNCDTTFNHCFVSTTLKVNRKPEIRPPDIRKRLKRWLPKFAGVTTSRISTAAQNCITVRLGDFAARICKTAYQIFTRQVFKFLGTENSLPLCGSADFDDQYVKRRRFGQEFGLTPFSPKKRKFSTG